MDTERLREWLEELHFKRARLLNLLEQLEKVAEELEDELKSVETDIVALEIKLEKLKEGTG